MCQNKRVYKSSIQRRKTNLDPKKDQIQIQRKTNPDPKKTKPKEKGKSPIVPKRKTKHSLNPILEQRNLRAVRLRRTASSLSYRIQLPTTRGRLPPRSNRLNMRTMFGFPPICRFPDDRHPPEGGQLHAVRLQDPAADYAWTVAPTQQSLEHAHHVRSLLSPRFASSAAAYSKSLSVSRSFTGLSGVGNHEIP